MRQHRICIVGSGYVGLVTGACLAEIGHRVVCVDSDKRKLALLKKGKNPIYEPGLDELLRKHRKSGSLTFAGSITEGLRFGKAGDAEVVFIAVGTPPRPNGSADLSFVEAVAAEVARNMRSYTIIVDKSTVPVETGEWVRKTVEHFNTRKVPFDVASNPEFLSEGSAVKDFLKPDRIVLGVSSRRAEELLRSVYAPLRAPVLVTDVKSAELIKHASNSFLATKISFINAVSVICEKTGADVQKVAEGMGADRRIGPQFLRAGLGFGGFCLPPDERVVLRDPNGTVRTLTMESAYRELRESGGWEALSLDTGADRLVFRAVTSVSRRPYDGLLVRVRTQAGRSVRVTSDHPLIVRRGDGWQTLGAADAGANDGLPLCLRLPSGSGGAGYDLIDALKARRPDFFGRVLVRPRHGARWRLSPDARKALLSIAGGDARRVHEVSALGRPLRLSEFLALEETGFLRAERASLELGIGTEPSAFVPAVLGSSPELRRLLGGARGTREVIAIHCRRDDESQLHEARTLLSGLGIRFFDAHVPRHRARRVAVRSRVFAFFVREVLGQGRDAQADAPPLPPPPGGARATGRAAVLERAEVAQLSGELAVVRVLSTERERYAGPVYSLEVEGTETFAAGSGLVVHNCFPKDLEAFYWIAQKKGYDFKLLQAVKEINEHQKEWPLRSIETELWNLEGKTVAVLGLSFKPNTDDLRFAPSLEIIEKLHAHRVKVTAYDPVAMAKARPLLKRVRFAKSAYDAVTGADCLILVTEWAEFRELDFEKVKRLMRHPIVLDGRNFFDPVGLRALGFTYKGVGRP
ncbi:MAG: nucleotide sugar dehydrogenase [Elusimicrobia bacterium]|nr:nucleotide sugar dehydrogenase [Elusimicrobiota bacterium]